MTIPDSEAKYIQEARLVFAQMFQMGSFDDASWSVKHLRKSQHRRTNSNVYFTVYGSTTEPLPKKYGDVVKAALLLFDDAVASMTLRADAFRMLWEAIKKRTSPDEFSWSDLQATDLLAAEQIMLQHWGMTATQKRCTTLLRLVQSLSATPYGAIVRPLDARFRTPRQEDFERYSFAGREMRNAKMPSDEALAALGDLFQFVVDERDRLLLCLVGLLIAAGFRVGEGLTLPEDCEVYEGTGVSARYGIRYFREKEQGGEKFLDVRWLKGEMTDLAKLCVAEARRLTAAARERAKVLERFPSTVPLPNVVAGDILTRAQVAEMLGCRPESVSAIKKSDLARTSMKGIRGHLYKAEDVSKYLLSKRGDLWVVKIRDGSYQHLSEILFIQFRNDGHARKATNPLLVECLGIQALDDLLGGRPKRGWKVVLSVFERYNLRDSNGNVHRMTSHQFRHWVTTIHAEAGTPDYVIARWQGRRQVAEVETYKHLTQEKRLETLRNAIEGGRVTGPLAKMYFSLRSDARGAFLEGQLQAVHFTPLGLCVHNFNESPCKYCLNCVKSCGDYLLDTSNKKHIKNLVQLKTNTELALDQAKQQCAKGEQDYSAQWVADIEETRAGVDVILRFAANAPNSIVQPFKGASSRRRRLG